MEPNHLKDAHKLTREARKELDYYKGLAGAYQMAYDDQTDVSDAITIIKGIAAELKGELNAYMAKNGQDERVIKSQRRINLLIKQTERVARVQSDNYNYKILDKQLQSENHILRCEIEDLKKQLVLHTEKFDTK